MIMKTWEIAILRDKFFFLKEIPLPFVSGKILENNNAHRFFVYGETGTVMDLVEMQLA